jgi:hypothetical protein
MGRRASREGRARPGGSDLAPCAAFYCCLCYCLWNVWVCVMTRMAMSIVPSSFLWHAGSPILPSSCSWPAGSAIGYVMCCCQPLQKMAANVMTLCLAWKLKKMIFIFCIVYEIVMIFQMKGVHAAWVFPCMQFKDLHDSDKKKSSMMHICFTTPWVLPPTFIFDIFNSCSDNEELSFCEYWKWTLINDCFIIPNWINSRIRISNPVSLD